MLRFGSLFFYLLYDQIGRWFRRPSSIIARFAVIAIMCGTAGSILFLFFIAEREVSQRIGELGIDRLLVVETIDRSAIDDGHPPVDVFIDQLKPAGQTYVLSDATIMASTEFGSRARVMTYRPQSWQSVIASDNNSALYFLISDQLPSNKRVICDAGGVELNAVTVPAPEWIAAMSDGEILLVPESDPWLVDRPFETRLTLYDHQHATGAMREVVDLTRAWLQMQNLRDFRIVHALAIADQLAQIRTQAFWWRLVLLVLFGGAIAVIFGMLALIEVNDNRDVNLVLRSLGASPWILFLRQAVEAIAVANAALVVSLIGVLLGLPIVFNSFGYSAEEVNHVTVQQFLGREAIFIGMFVNLGVLVSLFPVWRSVRGSIGRMLG